MAEIVNLRRFRKRQARDEAELNASAQRLKFGRSRVERAAEEAAEHKRNAALDGHRLRGDET